MQIASIPLICLFWLTMMVNASVALSSEARHKMPLPVYETNTANYRWLHKSVLASQLIDDMEDISTWSHRGFGEMTLTTNRAKAGLHSLRLVSPTKSDTPNKVVGRPFGEAIARRAIADADWKDFNRLSFWVYPDLPGFKVVSLLVKFWNDGQTKVPDPHQREGLHFVVLKNHQWNQVVWEIAHLDRDKVTAVEFIYRLQGHEPGATEQVRFDFDQFELQRVKADHFEGWNVADGKIAYSQTGYSSPGNKTALASGLDIQDFALRETTKKQVVFRGTVRVQHSDLGDFQVLDFTEFNKPGTYQLEAGRLVTLPFAIQNFVWEETIWKTINLFYCERCGDAIPGIHDVCHQDWRAEHNGKSIAINGGWHDAGDLSQGLVNTAEAVQAMLELSEQLKLSGSAASGNLADRLREEARWGLDWVLKNRFGDGYRVTWATMDFWTDGKPGNADDVLGDARHSPFENYLGAAAEAVAARVLESSDPALAQQCLQAAQDDWIFAMNKTRSPGFELAGACLMAAVEIFKVTREKTYADSARSFANVIRQCQQREWPDWDIPLTGFFYTSTQRDRIQHYFHRAHQQAAIVGLVELCGLFPEHADWMNWYSTVALYSEYLKRVSQFNEPYGVFPASIYHRKERPQQVTQGVKLSEDYYLRRFPVWDSFRGHFGVLLSQTKALAAAARLRGEPSLTDLCQRQLEWVVGRNPFACSTMFGEGHDYLPQYTAMSGDMVGSLPVGIQTRQDFDAPYWPAANCYNYAEVWVHPSTRWLSVMRELMDGSIATGRDAVFESLTADEKADGKVTLKARVKGNGRMTFQLRTHNLEVSEKQPRVEFESGKAQSVAWQGKIISPNEPWLAVVHAEGRQSVYADVAGNRR